MEVPDEALGQTHATYSPVTRLKRKTLGFESKIQAPSNEVAT